MPEHVCEWRKWHPWCAVYRCVYPRCYKNMPSDEVEHRLNATEKLMRMDNESIACELSATFDLGLDITRQIAHWMVNDVS